MAYYVDRFGSFGRKRPHGMQMQGHRSENPGDGGR